MNQDDVKIVLVNKISEKLKYASPKLRSIVAREINKGTTEGRREIVELLMSRTGLKRKQLNDRIVITRASPDALRSKLTPLYGKRFSMTEYSVDEATARGGRKVIRLSAQIYRKNMRTGFMNKGVLMLRKSGTNKVERVYGRSVPRLFESLQINKTYQDKITIQVLKRVNDAFVEVWRG